MRGALACASALQRFFSYAPYASGYLLPTSKHELHRLKQATGRITDPISRGVFLLARTP
jgi:hypothetical protein